MTKVSVTVNLSAESVAFMRKCIDNSGGQEQDEFFESAIAALAQALLDLDQLVPRDYEGGTRDH